jgi:hypothetical protein
LQRRGSDAAKTQKARVREKNRFIKKKHPFKKNAKDPILDLQGPSDLEHPISMKLLNNPVIIPSNITYGRFSVSGEEFRGSMENQAIDKGPIES